MSNDNAMIEAEKTDLAVHADLCAQRYDRVDRRLKRIENMLYVLIGGMLTTATLLKVEVAPILAALAQAALK
jgi:hypothetical protein